MPAESLDAKAIAAELDLAARNGVETEQISARRPLSAAEAYGVQRELLKARLGRGERLVGLKMGLTSQAKMRQVSVDEPILGFLTDAMEIDDAGRLPLGGFIHPRVEPEIAVLLGRDFGGDGGLAEASSAIAAVAPALEIIDSRYRDFRFELGDVIADNCSAAAFVTGRWSAPAPLASRGMLMQIDGRVAEGGTSSAILGDPLRSLVMAGRLAAAAGFPLRAGMIVLAGAATAAVPLRPSFVALDVQGLGRVSFTAHSEETTL